MTYINAKEARELAQSIHIQELYDVLEDIKDAAKKGRTKIYVYRSLNPMTIKELENLDFNVDTLSSIAAQRDGINYIIYW